MRGSSSPARRGWWGPLLAVGVALCPAAAALLELEAPLDREQVTVGAPALTVAGRAPAGVLVTLTLWDAAAGMVVAGPDGRFQFPPLSLRAGENRLVVTGTGRGETMALARTVILDAEPPVLSVSRPPAEPTPLATANPELRVVGTTEPGATVRVLIKGRTETAAAEVGPTGRFELVLARSLAEGENELVVEAADPAGNLTTLTRCVLLDRTAPPLGLLPPLDADLETAVPQVVVAGRTEPGAILSVVLNGQVLADLTVGGSGDFVLGNLPLDEGENVLKLKALDAVGNRAVLQRRVRRDTEPPPLTLEPPLDRDRWRTNRLDLTVAGASTPGQSVEVRLGGAAVRATADADGRFEAPPLGLADGANRVVVTASDALGNRVELARVVEVDRQPPSVQVTEPGPVDYVERPQIDLAGRTEARARVVLSGADWQREDFASDSGRFRLPGIPVRDGQNRLVITVADDLGNTTVLPVTIAARLLDPYLELVEPADEALTGRSVAVMVVVEATATVEASLDGEPVTGWEWSEPDSAPVPRRTGRVTLSGLEPGDRVLSLTAASPSGVRQAAVRRRFHVCGAPDTVTVAVEPTAAVGRPVRVQVTVLDRWARPVADGTVVIISLPRGWRAGQSAAASVQVETAAGAAVATLTPGRAGSALILVSAGRLTESARVRVRD